MSLREKILKLPKRTPTPVEMPEWGVTVYATFISALRQVEFREATAQFPDAPPRVLFAVFGIQDDAGELIFTDLDIPALCDMPANVIARLANAVIEQNEAPAKN